MKHAIEVLRQAAQVASNNAPINEAEGNLEQAALEREVAAECSSAIGLINRHQAMIEECAQAVAAIDRKKK